MPDQLHWQTVTPLLKDALTIMMESDLFHPFRLVGGTSLSLQLGHRISVDIDLFTDAPYGSIDFNAIDRFLRTKFEYVSEFPTGTIGMGLSYLVGNEKENTVKIDLYYTDTFIQPELTFGPYRLATKEEIIAMKIDIVQRKGRKKDFWDLHELMNDYSQDQMITLHEARYPHNHDDQLIRANFIDFIEADNDLNPICLKQKYWELIKYDIAHASKPG